MIVRILCSAVMAETYQKNCCQYQKLQIALKMNFSIILQYFQRAGYFLFSGVCNSEQ